MKSKRTKGPAKWRKGGPGRRPIVSITEHQRRTLREIRDFIACKGYPPTLQELAEILGTTHASTHAQVSQLVRKGYLKRELRKARGLAVVREPEDEITDLVPVPIFGRVARGTAPLRRGKHYWRGTGGGQNRFAEALFCSRGRQRQHGRGRYP